MKKESVPQCMAHVLDRTGFGSYQCTKPGKHKQDGFSLCGIHKNQYDKGVRVDIVKKTDTDQKIVKCQIQLKPNEDRWRINYNKQVVLVNPGYVTDWVKANPNKIEVIEQLLHILENKEKSLQRELSGIGEKIQKNRKLLEESVNKHETT